MLVPRAGGPSASGGGLGGCVLGVPSPSRDVWVLAARVTRSRAGSSSCTETSAAATTSPSFTAVLEHRVRGACLSRYVTVTVPTRKYSYGGDTVTVSGTNVATVADRPRCGVVLISPRLGLWHQKGVPHWQAQARSSPSPCVLSGPLAPHQLFILSRTPVLPAELPFDSLVAKIISQGINATGLGYVCTGCTTGLRV